MQCIFDVDYDWCSVAACRKQLRQAVSVLIDVDYNWCYVVACRKNVAAGG
ncbi:MAG: hypothetical protein J6B17_04465 [Ruminococcus sp.]|nr:hypothetical protein [Ruminococcus sp.]